MVGNLDSLVGIIEPKYPPDSDPERLPLYGGLSGLPLGVPEFKICEGLFFRETYAHVFAPYMLAFARPTHAGTHHPPPWKAAQGGLAFDVSIEVSLAQNACPTNFNRLNTLWWALALLRLITAAPLRMPVISDTAFAAISALDKEPNLWTIEMPPHQLRVVRNPPKEVLVAHMEWIRTVFVSGALLMRNPAFSRSFLTFDEAIWARNAGSAVIMAWTALETLFRPGRRQITKTLAVLIASFLTEPGSDRDRMYQHVEDLYEARGGVAHDAQIPEVEQLLDSFDLARRCLRKCLEIGEMPQAEELMANWKARQ